MGLFIGRAVDYKWNLRFDPIVQKLNLWAKAY